jgi:hypothetical protein
VSSGRPPEISDEVRARILALTRQSPPEKTGLSHWSSREMARYLKQEVGISVSHSFVAALWREYSLQPQRQGTFTLSTDPDVEEKVVDVVGLYLDPPMDAVVPSIDEKTQIQALDRTQPPRVGASAHQDHQRLHHTMEPRLETVHLDRDGERDHYQGSLGSPGLQETTRQQRQPEVKIYLLRNTRFLTLWVGHFFGVSNRVSIDPCQLS